MFNDRMKRLTSSSIQEMMNLSSVPGCISFAAGEPSMELYPAEKIKTAFDETLLKEPEVLAYSEPPGDPGLRNWISEWLYDKGYSPRLVGMERILLTNGSQAGLNLISLMFLEEGSRIMVEDPSYPEAILTFGKEGTEFFPVPISGDGPDIDKMEETLKKNRISFFYTIPTFQNPSGISTSAEKKRQVLALAEKYDFMIIEDDPYRELWFDDEPPVTYLSLSGDSGRVFYLGSFSKIVAPGVRCGYMVLPYDVMKKAVDLRVALEVNLPSLMHRMLHKVVTDPFFPHHLDHLRDVYRERRDSMAGSVDKYLVPLGFDFIRPAGGFFLWGRIPGIDGADFCRYAVVNEKIGVIPGEAFSPGGEGADFVRISFAQVLPDQAKMGVGRLERALKKYL